MAGEVFTARGKRLNMTELKLRQSKPTNSNVDMKDKVERRQRPVVQANVRGHMPSFEGVLNRTRQSSIAPPEVHYEKENQPSIAELTGIVIDNSDGRIDPAVAPHETLDNILGDLEQMRKQDGIKNRRSK